MWITYLEYCIAQDNSITIDEKVLDINPQDFLSWYAQHNSRAATTTPASLASTTPAPSAKTSSNMVSNPSSRF